MKNLVLLLALFVSVVTFAQNSKIKELEQQRKNMQLEIANTDKLLKETTRTTSTLLSRIKMISGQISARQQVLTLLNQEVVGMETDQKKIEAEIVVLEADLLQKQESYAKAIDGMLANRQNENKLLFILSGKSLSETYRRFRYLKDYSEWRSQQADDIKVSADELAQKKTDLLKSKSEKQALLTQRVSEQDNLKKEETNYQEEVQEAQKKKGELQSVLSEKKKQANALNKEIARMIAEEVARQQREAQRIADEKAKAAALAAAAAASKGGVPATTPKAATTVKAPKVQASPENITLSNNFSSNKGKLPYPISGTPLIVGRFGTHQHSQWNVTTANNGVDIQSQSGASAKSVFNGEVSKVMPFPGFNICIIIRHGNYYSFYGNIQNVTVKQGDKVTTGQSLGVIYTDSDTGTSQLQFQLWEGTTKLNPELWLRP